MARWIDSNGNYHNTDNTSGNDQGDLGKANDPKNWAAVQAAEQTPSFIDYRGGAGSGEWDRSTNSYYSGDRPFTAAAGNYATPAGGNPPASTSGVASMAPPTNQTIDPNLEAGRYYDPYKKESYNLGWAKTLQNAGATDPYANTPYLNYMGTLAAPLAQNSLLRAVLSGQMGNDNPFASVQQGFQGAQGSDLNAGSQLASFRNMAGSYFGDGQNTMNGSQLGFMRGLEDDPNSAMQFLGNMFGGVGGARDGIMSWLNKQLGLYNLQGQGPATSPWIQDFLTKFSGAGAQNKSF